jgi:hypothetical protein
MAHGFDEDLLRQLPQDVARSVRAALDGLAASRVEEPVVRAHAYPGIEIKRSPSKARTSDDDFNRAFEMLGYPERSRPIPLASELTGAQHALAEIVAGHASIDVSRWAIPQTAWARRRWLGVDPPGVLDRDTAYTVGGGERRGPLGRALTELEPDAASELFAALSPMDRLEAKVDIELGGYEIPTSVSEWNDFEDFRVEEKDRIAGLADRLTDLFSPATPASERSGYSVVPYPIDWLVFLGLVRAGVTVEPRWDWLLPAGWGALWGVTVECAAALPEPRRGLALARVAGFANGLDLVRTFPSRPLVEGLFDVADTASEDLGNPPRRTFLRDLLSVLGAQPSLCMLVEEKLASLPPLPPLRLGRATAVTRPDQLTSGLRTQLQEFFGWGDETELGGLEAFEIADDQGHPAYEALIYGEENGNVCRVGTTDIVASVSEGRLTCSLGEAYKEAFHDLMCHSSPSPAEGR